jgi:phage repressor protein C with HTH and peptisase S24 domain
MRPIKDLRRENLSNLASEYGGQSVIAAAIKRDRNQVYQWLLDPSHPSARGIGDPMARRIEEALNLPSGWLDTVHMTVADALTIADSALPSQSVPRFETDESYVRFPLMEGFAGMGKGDYVADYPEVVESLRVSREWVERKLPGVPPDAIRVITGRGDSMKGQYNDGDLIFIDTRIRTFDQDSAYCFRWEGRVLVKRLQFVGRGMLRILSKNPDYPAIDAPLDEIEIGGRALAAWTLREF